MVDTVKLVLRLDQMLDKQECCFPYLVGQKTNENGEVVARFYERESIVSPVTGAKCKVRALSADSNSLGPVAGYEMEVNVPACMNGRNHLLVNGVPRATEFAFELLRYYAADRGCTTLGLAQFMLENVRLLSVTPTFLFRFGTPELALEHLRELWDYADGLLNHEQRSRTSKRKKGRSCCYTVGADDCFTLYIKLREFTIIAYIKQQNVPDAFETFPSPEVEQELVEMASRTIRVEVEVHGKWLLENGLDDPEAWRENPSAYEKVFQLVRDTLRLDEGLRIRAPSEATIAKLPADHQTVLIAHLAGENIRDHELVLDCAGTVEQVIDAQNKKFSAFKRMALDVAAIDLSIPWEIQSTKLSAHLKDWLKVRKEFEPTDSIKEHVFSRTSFKTAVAAVKAATEERLANRPDEAAPAKTTSAKRWDVSDLDVKPYLDDVGSNDPGIDDLDVGGFD